MVTTPVRSSGFADGVGKIRMRLFRADCLAALALTGIAEGFCQPGIHIDPRNDQRAEEVRLSRFHRCRSEVRTARGNEPPRRPVSPRPEHERLERERDKILDAPPWITALGPLRGPQIVSFLLCAPNRAYTASCSESYPCSERISLSCPALLCRERHRVRMQRFRHPLIQCVITRICPDESRISTGPCAAWFRKMRPRPPVARQARSLRGDCFRIHAPADDGCRESSRISSGG